MLHHKLYLRNAPAEIQPFEISHGYNLACVNRVLRARGALWRAGAGIVVAHPEVTLRGRALPDRRGLFSGAYRVAGPVAQVAVEKRVTLTRVLFVAVEGKMTAAYARIPVPDGRATVPNLAAHGLVGIGLGR